jgi:hypothetical protein
MGAHTGVMAWSTRTKVVFAFAFPLISIGVKVLGDQYLRPIPDSGKLFIAMTCCGLIAVLAIYSRRRVPR